MQTLSSYLDESNMPPRLLNQTVLTCNLFGEASDLPDVVHCETIAARSVLHEWEFAPHRHARLHQLLFVASGAGRATLEGETHVLKPMLIVNVPSGRIHGYRFEPGTQGWVVTLASEILDEMLDPAEGLRRVLSRATTTRATADMRAVVERIFAEHAGRGFARAHLLKALSATLLGLVAREISADADAPRASADSDLVRRFEALLDEHFLEHWTVSQYAAALSVSPTHLSRLARGATGMPASQLILNRVMREARRNLVYTNLPVSTVAYALGFQDPAYFSRMFASAAGLSPRAFRSRAHGARPAA
jgi:AraC family transcriptional regulator, transcriptional activator of pobA